MSARRRDSITRAVSHSGPCGVREQCWLKECREEYGELRTVEVLASGVHMAYCHGEAVPRRDVEMFTWAEERRRSAA
jgi:hypothetical protein